MTSNLALSITTYQTFKNKGDKEMRETMNKLTQGATRLLVLALGLGLASTSWAATPTAEWCGTFPVDPYENPDGVQSSKNGTCTISKNNSKNVSTAKGIKILTTESGWPITVQPDSAMAGLTVVVGYRNPTSSSTGTIVGFSSNQASDGTKINANICSGGAIELGWGTDYDWSSDNNKSLGVTQPDDGKIHYVTLAYAGNATEGTTFWFDGANKKNISNLGSSGYTSVAEITLGAIRGPNNMLKGVEFVYVAVYSGVLSDADAVTAYSSAKSKVDALVKYEKWSYAKALLTWTTSGDNELASSNAKYTLFDIDSGSNTETVYNGAGTSYQLFGASASEVFWHYICDSGVGTVYSAPGVALRFSGDTAGKTIGGTFGPVAFGGIYVESGATGYSFTQTSGTKRDNIWGDPSDTVETWFTFEESFEVNRAGSFFFAGTVNLDLPESSDVLTLQKNSTYTDNEGHNPVIVRTYAQQGNGVALSVNNATLGGTLKMHGAGHVDVTTLTANGATLDFSDIGSRYNDTTPFINGELVVNADTKFVFPDGISYPYTYKVAASISDGSTIPSTWTVDGNVYAGVVSADKANGTITIASLLSATAIEVNNDLTISGATAANITVNAGKTLTLESGAALSGTVTGSGTIVCNQVDLSGSGFDNASGWTGKVQIAGDSTIVPTTSFAQGSYGNVNSTLEILSGSVLLTAATTLPGTVNVASGATLYMTSSEMSSLSIAGTNNGTINLGGASSLATLNLSCGASRALSGFVFPSSLTALNLTIAENATEDGEATVMLPTGSAVTTVSASVVDQNGVTKPATATLNGSTVAITFSPTVTGDACWHAYEFNNDWTDSVSVGAHECKTWNGNAPNFAEDSDKAGNYFVYTSIRPGPTDSKTAYSYPTEWSAAIRCTVPQTANGIIVCFGKVTNGAGQNQYIALVSGDTAGKVKLVHGAGGGAAQTIAEMTVANPTTSQHVYVFTKTATTVTVYCDGDLITSKAVSDSPYQAFQFGTMYGGMQSGSGLSDVTDKATGGMVDYTRLYNFAIGQNMIQKLAEDDPYVSSTPTYSREVSGSPWWHTGEGTWLKSDDSTLVVVPDVSGIVDVTATADATMTVNLPAAPVYEMLTFRGAGAVTLVKNGNSPKIATAKLVVKTNVTAPYDIADFSGARVSVDAGKVLTFDFSTYPLESVTGVTTQQVTGVTTRADDRYAVVASAKQEWNSNLSLIYDPVEYVYSVVIDPAALVTKNNTTVAYPTVAAALTALSTDAGTVRLLVDYDQDVTLSAGQTLDVGSTTYSGTVSVTGTNVEMVQNGTTYAAVDNSVNTWKSSVTAGHWNTASNWENGVVPKTYTRVTFPANDDPEFTGYTVTVKICGNNDVDWMPVCTGMVVNAKVDMVQDASGSNWGTIHLGGNISGTGTLALHKIGLHNSLGSSTPITVSCGLSVAIKDAADQDCYLYGGPFVFEGAVTATANVLFKAEYCAATFNGTVTMENGTTINGNGDGTTVYNGGISVPADAAATLVGGSRVTIASTVTLASGATLTVPNAASTSGATFETSVADSYVKATAGESTTVYSVAAKRTATVSVGTNAALSINGNAVADGDTLKFVPGDVLTITASADTYYTPALTVNGAAQTSPYELTTTDADVTVSVTATLDTYTITIPSVANTTVSVIYTSGSAAQEATAEGDITVDAGTSLTATWTAASGYKIMAGASQTINPVVSAQTLDSPTVEAKGATVSGVTFNYGDDFATATVTATVSGDATTYTLTVGGTDYPGVVDGSSVTFSGVATGHSSAYDSVNYTIAATDGTSSVVVSGGSGSAPVADVVNANWINENATTHGQTAAGGAWTNAAAVTYSEEGKAEISDNRFAATTASTASRVVLEFEVCFSSASEETVSGDAQAAIKLGEDNSVTTFKILTTGNEWTSVSYAGLQIDPSETYNVVLTIDYGSKTYKVDVGGNALTNSAGVASFALASSSASVQNIDFAGSGTLTSLKGSQFEGYMVKDALNNFYATIQAATQAYNSANGPYTVLHDGTAPDGWKIDETTKALIKLAKGFFFMAY